MAYEQDRFTDVQFLRNDEPVAAAVSMDRLDHLQLTEEGMADVSLALARMLTTGPERHALDDVLARFGYTRDDLRACE